MIAGYRIAKYLTPEQRAAMVAEPYPIRHHEMPTRRVSVGGRCPLGIALKGAKGMSNDAIPHADDVGIVLHYGAWRAVELGTLLGDQGSLLETIDAAEAFISDWDEGLIGPADLRAALGLPPDPPPTRRRAARS